MKPNTKLIMSLSAFFLGLMGLSLIFIPTEITLLLNSFFNKSTELVLQTLGALYFANALLNWMTRSSIIGGIYNRPIVIFNFTHFFIAGIAIIKAVFSNSALPTFYWAVAFLYVVFAISFGVLLFTHPEPKN